MSELVLAKNCGFCMGVRNAFQMATKLPADHPSKKICCYGEIVHNKYALQELSEKNIIIEDDLQTICRSDYNIVVIRAHGVNPTEENILQKQFDVVDLTCPNVKKVHKLAKSLSEEDYFIIILGKIGHPEVKGICGYCKQSLVVKNLDDLKQHLDILPDESKIAFISQTTANYNTFDEISAYLTQHFNDVKIVDTLCRAPINIQKDAISLAKQCDLMLIIGDRTSSNTTTLFDLCSKFCRTVFVENVSDIADIDFTGFNKIGFSAGSSTPQSQIDMAIDFVCAHISSN